MLVSLWQTAIKMCRRDNARAVAVASRLHLQGIEQCRVVVPGECQLNQTYLTEVDSGGGTFVAFGFFESQNLNLMQKCGPGC